MDIGSVDWNARRDAIEREIDNLEAAHPSGGLLHSMQRVVIRTLRVAMGVVFLVLSLYSCGQAPTDKPFAALTLGDVGTALFCWGLAILFFWWAFGTAFGSGPPQNRERHRAQAENNVDRRASALGGRY